MSQSEEAAARMLSAVQSGNLVEVASLIPVVGVDVRDKFLRTPLMLGAEKGDSACIDMLLKAGADPNARDDEGFTPLFYAAGSPMNQTVIGQLLAGGADVNAVDSIGNTVLMVFAKDASADNIRQILLAAPAIDHKNFAGDTALTNAACWGSREIVQELVFAGADLNLPDGAGCTAVQLARTQNHPQIVEFLKENGAAG